MPTKRVTIASLFSLYFCLFFTVYLKQLIVNKIANNWIRSAALWCLEATAQPTAPQPMPRVIFIFDSTKISIRSKSVSLLVFVVVVVFDQFRWTKRKFAKQFWCQFCVFVFVFVVVAARTSSESELRNLFFRR